MWGIPTPLDSASLFDFRLCLTANPINQINLLVRTDIKVMVYPLRLRSLLNQTFNQSVIEFLKGDF